jgi:hypothetical protein
MITIKEIAWVAGLLEGEGNFRVNVASPRITIKMCDLDIIERFKSLTKSKNKIHRRGFDNPKHKPCYGIAINGIHAIQWMMTVYPLMGLRRKTKIREILHFWKSTKDNRGNHGQNWAGSAPDIKIRKILHAAGKSNEEIEDFLAKHMTPILR